MEFHYPQYPVPGNPLYADPDDRILEGEPGPFEQGMASVSHHADVRVHGDAVLAGVLQHHRGLWLDVRAAQAMGEAAGSRALMPPAVNGNTSYEIWEDTR